MLRMRSSTLRWRSSRSDARSTWALLGLDDGVGRDSPDPVGPP